jgi:hypothetical protein
VAGTRRRPRRDAAGPGMAMGSSMLRGGLRTALMGSPMLRCCGVRTAEEPWEAMGSAMLRGGLRTA